MKRHNDRILKEELPRSVGAQYATGDQWGNNEMAGWHHRLDGCESEWTPGVGDKQGGLACCGSWRHKESDMTEWRNWTELEHSLVLSSWETGMKTDLLQSCGPCWVFQICWLTGWITLKASSFRILSSSTGISSSPLTLLAAVLLKAHLTSHSRMSSSRWVITPLWLSGSIRSFLYSSYVYSCHLFLISSASIRSLPLLSFTMSITAWNVLLISQIFLKRSVVVPHSIVFLYFFALFIEKGLLISPCYSLELCI